MQIIKITCIMEMLEDFHLGTGTGNIGLFDDGQYRDQGVVSIRESSLKGLLKDSCRQINQYHADFADGKEDDCNKYYHRIFESHQDLHSLDIQIEPTSPEEKRNNTVIHFFTALDSETGTAQANTLRSLEFGAKSLKFRVRVSYICQDEDSEAIKDYLEEALRNIKSLGGHRRRGFGALHISEIQSTLSSPEAVETLTCSGSSIELILELQEDTLISAKAQSGNMLETNDYITGTTILGMLRAKLLGMKIKNAYLDDDSVRASFFYPLPVLAPDAKYIVHPVFTSLRKKKDYRKVGKDEEQIPIWALCERSPQQKSVADILSQNTLRTDIEHSDPSKGMYDGYLCLKTSESQDWGKALYYKARTRTHQRNDIDPSKQRTKQDGGVFVEQRIEKGSCFMGRLHFKDESACADFCRDFSPWLSGANMLNLGRGAKPCKIKSYTVLSVSDTNHSLVLDDNSFTISLISDVVLFDAKLRPVSHFNEECLASLLGDSYCKDDFVLERYSERSGITSSFSGTTGLRRFRDIAIRKGSSYRFVLQDPTKTESLVKDLQALEQTGIGIKKNEGFGVIVINHPIHGIAPAQLSSDQAEAKLCVAESIVNNAESRRLTDKAKVYHEADDLLSKLQKEKNETRDLWKSFAFKIINLISENDSRNALNAKLHDIEEVKNEAWESDDYRMKILSNILASTCSAESVKIALQKLLAKSGGKSHE